MSDNNKKGFWRTAFGLPAAKVERDYAASPAVLPPPRSTALDLTIDRALSIPTVYRSVSLITGGVRQLTLKTYRSGDEIDSPLIVQRPDNNRSLGSFLKRTTTDLALTGNAYWKITRNAAGVVNNLEVLNPVDVHISWSNTGVKSYRYGEKTFSDSSVKHLRLSEVPGHDYGVGPVQTYTAGLSRDLDLREYAGKVFKDGVPAMYLTTDQELEPDEADAIENRWYTKTADGRVPVLGKGTGTGTSGLNLSDLQYIEAQNLNDVQVARIFGIPSAYLEVMVGGSNLTYTNRQELDTQFVRWCLMDYLQEIEDAMSDVLPRGQYVRFNVEDFLRAYVATPEAPVQPIQTKESDSDTAA